MGGLFSYSIATGIVLMVLYIVYKWLLASENQPRLNRAVLLIIYAVSFIMPFMPQLHMPSFDRFWIVASEVAIGVGNSEAHIVADDADAFDWFNAIIFIYGLGMLVVAVRTAMTAASLYKLVKGGRKEYAVNYTVVYINRSDIAPFSWGNYIVLNEAEDRTALTMIETHELAHIKSRHFIDLIISQLTCIILWYNPASWLMQNELKAVHEYEADERVILSGCNARDYQLLLVKKAVGQRFPSLANSLNHSKLKKRITMMYSKKTSAARRSRVMALVPAAALGLLLLNVPTVSEAMDAASTANVGISSLSRDKVITNSAAGQVDSDKDEIVAPEQMPEFEGGIDGLVAYMTENLTYPDDAMKADIQGYVLVQFTVTKNGEIDDVTVLRAVHPSLDAEAIRVVKTTSGKWTPGKLNGQNVSVRYALPVSFKTKK